MIKQTTCYSCDKPIEPEWLPEGEFIVCDECSSDTDEKTVEKLQEELNSDMQNLLNAYDSNWDDYLALRKQFIEKYSLSVEKLQEIRVEELKDFNSKILQAELKNQKLQEQLNTAKKALTEITEIPDSDNYFDCEECIFMMEESAKQALAAIGGDDE